MFDKLINLICSLSYLTYLVLPGEKGSHVYHLPQIFLAYLVVAGTCINTIVAELLGKVCQK